MALDDIAADPPGRVRHRGPGTARRSSRRRATRTSLPALVLIVGSGLGCAPAEVIGDAEPSSPAAESVATSTTAHTATDRVAGPAPDAPAIAIAATASEDPTRLSIPTSVDTVVPATTRYAVPVADPGLADWNPTHAAYPASDIFVAGGCGATVVSPVDGVVTEVRTVDSWSAAVDDPATRGGRSVTIVGNDGVRYYLAHFETIEDPVVVGAPVPAGTPLGTVGASGRASACHVHFGISPPCPEREWSVRRGVIWPYPYLDAWADGTRSSPAEEIAAWLVVNPDACALAAADPHAQDG